MNIAGDNSAGVLFVRYLEVCFYNYVSDDSFVTRWTPAIRGGGGEKNHK